MNSTGCRDTPSHILLPQCKGNDEYTCRLTSYIALSQSQQIAFPLNGLLLDATCIYRG